MYYYYFEVGVPTTKGYIIDLWYDVPQTSLFRGSFKVSQNTVSRLGGNPPLTHTSHFPSQHPHTQPPTPLYPATVDQCLPRSITQPALHPRPPKVLLSCSSPFRAPCTVSSPLCASVLCCAVRCSAVRWCCSVLCGASLCAVLCRAESSRALPISAG